MAAEAAPPPSSPSAAGANPSRNPKRKRKPKPKAAGPSALNPNWAQLQSKLPQRPAATHLGKRNHDAGSPSSTHAPAEASPPPEKEVKLEPTSDDASLTKAVAIDCEMVGVGSDGSKSALGRVTLLLRDCRRADSAVVRALRCGAPRQGLKPGAAGRAPASWSVTEQRTPWPPMKRAHVRSLPAFQVRWPVNSFGNVVYDEYVRTVERIVDYRTRISGIRPKHMNKAKEFWVVQIEVAELIKGRILVGHALHNDLKVLLLSHPKKDIRDTSEYEIFRRERKRRSLKDLAAEVLGAKIQQSEHCPIEDARAAMFIYNKHKKTWEKNMKEQFRFKKKLKKRGKKKPAESNANDPNVPTVLL